MPRFAWTDHGDGGQLACRSIGGRHDSGWGVLPSNYPHGHAAFVDGNRHALSRALRASTAGLSFFGK